MFNGTLHAGEIKTYIQFCLAISHQALVQNKASRVIRLMRNIRSGLGFYDLDLLAMNLKQHDIIF